MVGGGLLWIVGMEVFEVLNVSIVPALMVVNLETQDTSYVNVSEARALTILARKRLQPISTLSTWIFPGTSATTKPKSNDTTAN